MEKWGIYTLGGIFLVVTHTIATQLLSIKPDASFLAAGIILIVMGLAEPSSLTGSVEK